MKVMRGDAEEVGGPQGCPGEDTPVRQRERLVQRARGARLHRARGSGRGREKPVVRPGGTPTPLATCQPGRGRGFCLHGDIVTGPPPFEDPSSSLPRSVGQSEHTVGMGKRGVLCVGGGRPPTEGVPHHPGPAPATGELSGLLSVTPGPLTTEVVFVGNLFP